MYFFLLLAAALTQLPLALKLIYKFLVAINYSREIEKLKCFFGYILES